MGKKGIEDEKRKARRYIYIGENNCSVYERGIEHQNDVPACKTSSHMLRHLLMEHEDEEDDWDKIEFGMKILKSTRTETNPGECNDTEEQAAQHHE